MSGWLNGTRVQAPDGRLGTVAGDALNTWPYVRWDDGGHTYIDGALLARSPDDWFARAVNNTEKM